MICSPKVLQIGVVGASGYSGAELVRLLLQHPYCGKEGLTLLSSSLQSVFVAAGRMPPQGLEHGIHCADYSDFYPAFYGLGLNIYGLPSEDADLDEWLAFYSAFDVIFLATPHAASVRLVQRYFEVQERAASKSRTMAKLIDLSGALRLGQPGLYQQWYKEQTLGREALSHCQYGLSELFPNEIRKARIIANPGCYATAVILALAPLAAGGLLGKVRIDAKSGVSGAGKKASDSSHFPQANESLSLYKLHQHQHTPEIEMVLASLVSLASSQGPAGQLVPPITFSTHLLPINRGIMATCYIELLATSSDEQLQQLYAQFYGESPFVQVRPAWTDETAGANGLAKNIPATQKTQKTQNSLNIPQIQDVCFSNRCDIGLRSNPRNNELVVVSVIDNLLKGAAGQAIQNMNLIFGFEQACGLPLMGALP